LRPLLRNPDAIPPVCGTASTNRLETPDAAPGFRKLLTVEARPTEETEHGRKYEIRASITGPNGRSTAIITAWIVMHGEEFPRFITAYPEE